MKKIILAVISSFLALTSISGGAALILDINTPPKTLLDNSPFSNYLIPGLALTFIVGISSLVGTIYILKNHKYAYYISFFSGITILIFELVEILTIGSPVGVARNLQLLYLIIGTLMLALSLRILYTNKD